MSDLSEKFRHLEVSNDLFKDVKFYVTGEVNDDVISLLNKGGADQSKYFSDFVTHLICGENPEETDIIDATDVYEVPAVQPKWIVISSQLNRLVSTKPYLFNRQQIFANKTFCLSKLKEDLECLWALITYQGGRIKLNLDQSCNYLVTVDTTTLKYEKASSLGPEKICIVTPDWILECVKTNELVQPDSYHPRLLDWPKPTPPVHHESTTAITGFEESETEKEGGSDQVASSTQALLEKLKQRMPWNQPEQQSQPKNEQKLKEIVPPNVVAPSFQQQKQGELTLSHQQILQKLQLSQSQGKASISNIPQQMTPEQQQMVQNALQQAQQNIHSQRMNQQGLSLQQAQTNTQMGFSQPQQSPIQAASPLQQSPVSQGPRAVLHHLPQGQQLQFQQQQGNVNRNITRPSLQQLRGQLGTTQLQQQLLQQQQQRLNQQQQQNVLQRPQLSMQQQQLLQLQLQQGQMNQARQLVQQQNQLNQPNPQLNAGNQMINAQQLSQFQNRAQQLNQQKLAQNQQISQLLAQRQAQMGHRMEQDQQQIAQNRVPAPPNQQHMQQQMKLQQQTIQTQQLGQNAMDHQMQVDQQMGQNQGIVQNQQVNQDLAQKQLAHGLSQQQGTSQLLQSLGGQNQQQQRLLQNQQDQTQQESPRQQINTGLNHILNQQINQGNMVQQQQQQRLAANQLLSQQLNQLNQQLNQGQIAHQQIPQSPNQFGNIIPQQQQQLLGNNQLSQVRQVVGNNQQIIQQQQFASNQQQFGQQVQQQTENSGQVQQQQQLLNQQQQQFGQQQVQAARPHLQQQQLWTQQQAQGQQQMPPRQPLQQQGQRVQWSPGNQQGQGVQPRQFIHLDAQTHNQLQKMPPEQQALFIARLQQKQRQLLLKQAQQRGGGHILIRGPVPAGLNPQQQMAWLQQQANKQGVVLPTNLQQQTVSSTTMNQQPGPSGAAAGPSGLGQAPGLSPIQQQQQSAQEQKLKQIRLQQLQREQQQQVQKAGSAAPPLQPGAQQRPVMTQAAVAADQPVPIQDPAVGQSQVLVNPKTKTALANMLSIRLQSGGAAVGAPTDAIPEPSAAGTLRLMTAQHNASLNSRPLDLLAMQQQQRRALGGPPGAEVRPPVPQNLPIVPQPDQQQPQASKSSTQASLVPMQHRPGPFYGHNPNLKLPEEQFFLGCVFVAVEIHDILKELMPNFKEKIELHGGEVEKQYNARVTHVVCLTQRHGIVMQALRDCKRCVTLYWLEDVIKKKQLLPPWVALHVPAMYIDTYPCSRHLMTSEGFEGQDKDRVEQMIRFTGAKYTDYMSKHNTLLIAANTRGNKFKRSKSWGIPVVNIQWLTDILLGNYPALQQLENVIYQQFNEPPSFTFDPKQCPNIMHGWKMPINISQDTYEKVKKAIADSKKDKKEEGDNDSEEDDDMEDEEEGSSTDGDDYDSELEKEGDAMVKEQCATPHPEYNIMFSSVLSSSLDKYVQSVKELGGTVTNDWTTCTHLLMEVAERTIKLMFCIPRQIPILPMKWLRDSKLTGKFLDPAGFYFQKTVTINRSFNCNFNAVLKMENRDKLLAGKIFWVTPSVYPNARMVRRVIEASGGVVEEVRRTGTQIEAVNTNSNVSYFILTDEDDIHLVGDLLRKKEKYKYICYSEMVLQAVMRQKFEVEPWVIEVNE